MEQPNHEIIFSHHPGAGCMFLEAECHTLIGIATVWLECLYQNVPLDYTAPIISQQGEVRSFPPVFAILLSHNYALFSLYI